VSLQNLVKFVVRIHAGIDRDHLSVGQEFKVAREMNSVSEFGEVNRPASKSHSPRLTKLPHPETCTHGIRFHQPWETGSTSFRHFAQQYDAGPYKGYGKKIQEAFAAIVPDDADVSTASAAIVKVVDAPFGKRPFRVHIDPTQDGAEVAFAVMDRLRMEMLHRVRLDELLTPVKT
jgi:hypothetical protein